MWNSFLPRVLRVVCSRTCSSFCLPNMTSPLQSSNRHFLTVSGILLSMTIWMWPASVSPEKTFPDWWKKATIKQWCPPCWRLQDWTMAHYRKVCSNSINILKAPVLRWRNILPKALCMQPARAAKWTYTSPCLPNTANFSRSSWRKKWTTSPNVTA